MRATPIDPALPLPGAPSHSVPRQHAQAPPGFEIWFAQALSAGRLGHDPALETGPADFGLWGVAPDGQGRLNLDEVAGNLQASLAAFAANLGKACRQQGIALPPPLRLEAGMDTQPLLLFDAREAAIQQLFDDWPGLARQFRRLMAGFGFVRCSDALRAYQRAIGRLGPSRLASVLDQQGDAHASPHLALVFDGLRAWPEEAYPERWRPLAGLEQLSRELFERAHSPSAPYRDSALPLEQLLDPKRMRWQAGKPD